ncbi:hypothetical protein BC628DRAFT_1330232, partial [Trametes gibbosa]
MPRSKAAELPPEAGRLETAREFSKRVRLVLHGPRAEREEGTRVPSASTQPVNESVLAEVRETEGDKCTPGTEGDNCSTELSTPPLIEHLATSTDGIHLQDEIRHRYNEDAFFGDILTNLKQHKNFSFEDGLVLLKDQGRELLCVPNILVSGRNVREIVISHVHSLLAHLGPHKTSSLLCDHVWWKT